MASTVLYMIFMTILQQSPLIVIDHFSNYVYNLILQN